MKLGLLSLVLALTSTNLHAEARGAANWITFQNVRDKLSFACDAMLAQPADTGTRKDNLQVVRELAIPREQVRNLLAATPAPNAPKAPNLPQRLFNRIKSFLSPAAAPAPTGDASVLIENLRAPDVSPAARVVLEQVATRMEEIQAGAALTRDQVPVRNLLRGRIKIQKYVAGLAAQTELLQNHLHEAAQPVAVTSIPGLDAALTPAALDEFIKDDARPFLETRWSNIKMNTKVAGLGLVLGLSAVSIFRLDAPLAVSVNLALGGGLYYASESFRGEVNRVIGEVKSLYRDWRAAPPPPAAAEIAAIRLARVQTQLNVYRDITEHLTGKKPRRGFAYYKYESDSAGQPVQVEHILFTDMKNHAMFTIITNLETRGVTFTRVELP